MDAGQPIVLYEVQDAVATVTLNRPEKLNALSPALYEELDATVSQAEADPAVRTVVLTGAGRAFSVGADLSGGPLRSGLLKRWEKFRASDRRQFRLWDSDKIVVAAVHGYCLGRGLELALWCDIVIAAEDARLGQPEVRDGSLVSSIIPWLIGPQRAKLLLLTGDLIDAREAERIGLIARVVETGQAQSEAIKLAHRLSHVPPVTALAIKRFINGVCEQAGLRSAQAAGAALSTLISSMTAGEKGTEDLERIRLEKGLKAYVEARDALFR